MTTPRYELTPQMAVYDDFVDRAETRWLPYLMYFHRADYRSDAVNTDRLGFRISHGRAGEGSVAGTVPEGPISLVAGSSTAFGVGARSDAATIASRLWTEHSPHTPWLNLGGRGYCSTQELLLFLLHRQLLPRIENIVILSGLNNLALAGLPSALQGDYGAFFFSGEYYRKMDELRAEHHKTVRSGWFGRGERRADPPLADGQAVSPDERMATAVQRTREDLERWKLLAGDTRISYALQPLATWVRDEPAPQEVQLFAELDRRASTFWQLFGDIAPAAVGGRYAAAVADVCGELGVDFVDLNPALARQTAPGQWLFVDRAHFTDDGYDLVARLLATELSLKN